jgi:hypothetical protein
VLKDAMGKVSFLISFIATERCWLCLLCCRCPG